MESRRNSRAVVDPKVRQVGFFTSSNQTDSTHQPDPIVSDSHPVSTISPSGNSLSPVMIPPPRHNSSDAFPLRAAAAASAVSSSSFSYSTRRSYIHVVISRLFFFCSRIQTMKALTREREWLAKQIPKKFQWNQRIELYRKWGIKLNSKLRSLQVAHNLWTNTQDMEQIKESASLVAKLLGFVEPSRMPKEMFGLSLLPRTENIKSSGWRFTKSFSGIRLTGS